MFWAVSRVGGTFWAVSRVGGIHSAEGGNCDLGRYFFGGIAIRRQYGGIFLAADGISLFGGKDSGGRR